MKNVFIAIVFLFYKAELSFSQELKSLENDSYSVSYPSSLVLDQSGVQGSIFVLSTEQSDESDSFIENINLASRPADLDFESALKQTESQLNQVANLIESKVISVGGRDCGRFIFEINTNGVDLTFIQHLYLREDHLYALTFSSTSADFNSYYEVMNQVMMTFKLKD